MAVSAGRFSRDLVSTLDVFPATNDDERGHQSDWEDWVIGGMGSKTDIGRLIDFFFFFLPLISFPCGWIEC